MAFFSLQTGARAGEVFSLTWGDIDLFQATALLRDTKSNKNRPLFLTDEVKTLLAKRRSAETKSTDLVFPDRNGNKVVQISDTFNRAIDKLKLNEGITDRRDKVTFHSLRHTYASMLNYDESLVLMIPTVQVGLILRKSLNQIILVSILVLLRHMASF